MQRFALTNSLTMLTSLFGLIVMFAAVHGNESEWISYPLYRVNPEFETQFQKTYRQHVKDDELDNPVSLTPFNTTFTRKMRNGDYRGRVEFKNVTLVDGFSLTPDVLPASLVRKHNTNNTIQIHLNLVFDELKLSLKGFSTFLHVLEDITLTPAILFYQTKLVISCNKYEPENKWYCQGVNNQFDTLKITHPPELSYIVKPDLINEQASKDLSRNIDTFVNKEFNRKAFRDLQLDIAQRNYLQLFKTAELMASLIA